MTTTLTFDHYCMLVEQATVEWPDWRDGQAAFNILASIRPDLSEPIRGNPALDPFHNDEILPLFSRWVRANWEPLDEPGTPHSPTRPLSLVDPPPGGNQPTG